MGVLPGEKARPKAKKNSIAGQVNPSVHQQEKTCGIFHGFCHLLGAPPSRKSGLTKDARIPKCATPNISSEDVV